MACQRWASRVALRVPNDPSSLVPAAVRAFQGPRSFASSASQELHPALSSFPTRLASGCGKRRLTLPAGLRLARFSHANAAPASVDSPSDGAEGGGVEALPPRTVPDSLLRFTSHAIFSPARYAAAIPEQSKVGDFKVGRPGRTRVIPAPLHGTGLTAVRSLCRYPST